MEYCSINKMPGSAHVEQAVASRSLARETHSTEHPWNKLSDDAVLHILSKLDWKNLASFRGVDQRSMSIVDGYASTSRLVLNNFFKMYTFDVNGFPSFTLERYIEGIRSWVGGFCEQELFFLDKNQYSPNFPRQLFFSTCMILGYAEKFRVNLKHVYRNYQKEVVKHFSSFSAGGMCAVSTPREKEVMLWGQANDGSWNKKEKFEFDTSLYRCFVSRNAQCCVVSENFSITFLRRNDYDLWERKQRIDFSELVTCCDLSADGSQLLVKTVSSSGQIWNLDSQGEWNVNFTFRHDPRLAYCSPCCSGNNQVLVAIIDGALYVHEKDGQGNWGEAVSLPDNSLYYLKSWVNHDGTCVFALSYDLDISIWQKENQWSHRKTFRNLGLASNSIKFVLSQGSCSSIVWSEYKVLIVERNVLGDWEVTKRITPESELIDVDFSCDGNHLAIVRGGRETQLWGKVNKGGEEVWENTKNISQQGRGLTAHFNIDGNHLIITSSDGTAEIWGQFYNGKWHKKAIVHHGRGLFSARMCNDGRHIMTAGNDFFKIWEIEKGRVIALEGCQPVLEQRLAFRRG